MHGYLWLFLFINDAISTLFTGAQQTKILNGHNSFCSNLARGLYKAKNGVIFVKATNMRKLVWNFTLVNEASSYAVTCPPSAASSAGMNVYIKVNADSATIETTATNSWANEFFANGPKAYITTAATKHATQMAWSTTTSIGCAYAKCSTRTIVVCNYYPPGNAVGQKIYNQGAICSKCPTGSSCLQASGLCATPSSIVFPAAVQSSILLTINGFRSNVALGNEKWTNYTWDYEHENNPGTPANTKMWPKGLRMCQIRWSPKYATAAAARLDAWTNAGWGTQLPANPFNVAEIGHGIYPMLRTDTPATPQQMFDNAWNESWYGYWSVYGTLPWFWDGNTQIGNASWIYQDYAYTLMSGNAQLIGCAYRKMSGQYAVLCQIYPACCNPAWYFTNAGPYIPGTPVGKNCPANGPPDPTTGLCTHCL